MTVHEKSKPKSPKPKINPIEEAIGERAAPPAKLTIPELQKAAKDVKKKKVQGLIAVPLNPSVIPDVPSPSEMLDLEELNRQTEERLRDDAPLTEKECLQQTAEIPNIVTPKSPIPVSKPDPQPVTKTFSPESPPQKIDTKTDSNVAKEPPTEFENLPTLVESEKPVEYIPPAEDIELTALRKYILEDGFVLATVAFHIVTLCAQPMVTPSTTTWNFRDRASVPDMVLALLNQPGYLEGIWPSLKIVMGTNKGNAAWCAGISTTIAFFDVVRTLPAIEELKNETV